MQNDARVSDVRRLVSDGGSANETCVREGCTVLL